MSLHALATNMASKGRNGDSMLVHMTPSEVHGLQALAMKHGGSLTVNPDTGLPEANFLKSLLPMIAGFALGPAGFGVMSSAMGAGALVGGLTGIATGSLSKGLMAGLGAYGGFGIGEGLSSLGASEMSAGTIQSQMPEFTGNVTEYADKVNALRADTLAAANTPGAIPSMDKLSAGFNSATSSPASALSFAKNNMMPLAAAAAPIAADMMVPTTTKMPTNTNPAYIRQYVAGDRPQAPRALAPVLASEWGSRSFQDAYAKPMATGGIVALAAGGAPKMLTDEELYQQTGSWEAAAAARDAQNNALNQYNWSQQAEAPAQGLAAVAPTYNQYSNEQIASYLATNPDVNIAEAIKTTNADPAAVNAYLASIADPFKGSTDTQGGSGVLGIYNQMKAQGVDPTELYAAELASDPKYAGYTQPMIQKAYDLSKGAYALSDQLKGNVSDKDWVKFMDDNKYSIDDAAQAFGLSRNEVRDRYNAVKNAEKKTTAAGAVVNPYTGIASVAGPTTTTELLTTPQTNAPAGTSNPYGNVNNPGDLTFNPDGTVTVQPNLPGRPYGGYSGIAELTGAYTAGGGSTGYVSPVVKTAAEHDATYNKMTDDSLDAYNYLIGKGGAKYPTKSRATEIMKPYEEAVLGYPTDITKKKYINVGGKMVLNPNYVAPQTQAQKTAAAAATAKAGKPSTIEVTDSSGENTQTITAVLQDDGNYLGGNGKKYTAAGIEIMAQGGMAGYAVGGGLGTLGGYSDGGRLLKGPGDGVSDSIPATIGRKQQPARLADGEFVVPARIVSELGNGSTDAGARKLYAMMDRVQKARGKTTGKKRVATNTRADKYLPA